MMMMNDPCRRQANGTVITWCAGPLLLPKGFAFLLPFALIGMISSIGTIQSSQLLYSTLRLGSAVRQSEQSKETGISQESWCPRARNDRQCNYARTTNNDHTCNLCQEKFLIILALGRTASTTLTWTLDALPGIQMGGENKGVLAKFKTMMDETAFSSNYVKGENKKAHPWGHAKITDPTNLYCAAQQYIRALYPPWSNETDPQVIGFKTIRFLPDTTVDKNYTDFLTSTFPCARYVINYRSDFDALQKSQDVSFGGHITSKRLQQDTLRLKAVAKRLGPDRAYLLDSSEWTSNITKINELVRWLGFGSDCDFAETLELNTVDQYSHGKDHYSGKDRRRCRYVGGTESR